MKVLLLLFGMETNTEIQEWWEGNDFNFFFFLSFSKEGPSFGQAEKRWLTSQTGQKFGYYEVTLSLFRLFL